MKIAIIGAGTNGLYISSKLTQKGHEVDVFDKKQEIKNQACSGLFSQRIIDFIPECEKLIQNKIKYVKINFPKKTVFVKFSKDFYVIDHSELDKLISVQRLYLGHNISELPKGYDKIIGCDGGNSFVRRKLNLPEPNLHLGIQGFVEEEANQDFVEVWPIKQGFIWKIPKGDKIEYGIMGPIKTSNNTFKKYLKENNIYLKEIKAKVIPQSLIIPDNNDITLCGDSAGMTKPWSGGGVIWGLKASDILIKNFPDFMNYKKEAESFFNKKIILGKTAVWLAYFLGFKAPIFIPKNNKIESDYLL